MKIKRLLSMFLCVCLLVSQLPTYAFAEDEEGVQDETVTEPESGPTECSHEYTVLEVIEPTCTEQGYTVYACSLCGDLYKDNYTDPIPHTPGEEIPEIPATSSEEGRTAGHVCVFCGAVIDGFDIIPVITDDNDHNDEINDDASEPTLTAKSPDSEPPELVNITLSTATVTAPGRVEVIVEATDDNSGVKTGYADFSCRETQRSFWVYFDIEEDGKLHGVIDIDQYVASGTFVIQRIEIEDAAGNGVTYLSSDDGETYAPLLPASCDNLSFTVVNEGSQADSEPPELVNITLSTATVTAPGRVEVTVEATDDNSGVKSGYADFSCRETQRSFWVSFDIEEDGKLHGVIDIDQYVASGTFIIQKITIEDAAGNFATYLSSDDGETYAPLLPASLDNIGFTVINESEADTTPPELVNITLNPVAATAPGRVEVTVEATDDNSGAASGYADFSCSETQKGFFVSLYIEDDGKLHGVIDIDQYVASGTFIIQKITIEDAAGNYATYLSSDDGETYAPLLPASLDNLSFTVEPAYYITRDISGLGTIATSADYDYGYNRIESYAKPGVVVSVNATPIHGYKLEEGSLAVYTLDDGSMIELNNNSFVMPDEAVVISATFVEHADAMDSPYLFSDVAVEKTEYTYGETIHISFKAEGANIDQVYLNLIGPNHVWRSMDSAVYNSVTGRYESSAYVTNQFSAGNWMIGSILIIDNNDNYYEYYNSATYSPNDDPERIYRDFSLGDFIITGEAPAPAYEITNLSIGKHSYTYGETIKIQFKITDNNTVDGVYLDLIAPDGTSFSTGTASYNKTSRYYVFSEYITNIHPSGGWRIGSIQIVDKNGNVFTYCNSELENDFEDDAVPADFSVGDFTITGVPPDGNYTISDISANGAPYLRGQDICIQCKVSGSNIGDVYLDLLAPDGIWYSIWATAYNKTSHYFEFSEHITNAYPSGDWKVALIWIYDKNGNRYTYCNSELKNVFEDEAVPADLSGGDFTILESYIVHFEGNGNSGGSMTDCGFLTGTNYSLPTNTFVNAGQSFTGWNTEPDGTGTAFSQNEEVIDLAGVSSGYVINLYAQWTPTPYTITYYLDGGANSDANPNEYTIESDDIVLGDPYREGYSFAGWYKESSFRTRITKISQGTIGNLSFFAKWKANDYTVEYIGNGETSGTMAPQVLTYDKSTALTANAFKRTNYTFIGWSISPVTDDSEENQNPDYADRQKVMNLSSDEGDVVRLYAVWVKNSYRIVLNANGGSGDMSEESGFCEHDGSYRIPLNLFTRPGFTFQGWAVSSRGKVVYADGASISGLSNVNGKVINLYAVWSAHKYSIEFDKNAEDATGSMKPLQNISCGTSVTLNANSFKRSGYTFLGWSEDPNAEEIQYGNKAKHTNYSTLDGAVIKLYAIWTPTAYKITYKNAVISDGNYDVNPNEYTIESDTITLVPLTRPGCTFEGWYSDAKCTKPATKIFTCSTGARTFYAKWTGEANRYTVEFEPNGGSGRMTSEAMTCGIAKALTANAFKRSGYIFAGWNTQLDGSGIEYLNKETVLNLTEENGGRISLYAQWEAVEYQINYKNVSMFDTNDNPAAYSLEDDIPVDFNHLNDPERPGCVFDKWYIDSGCRKPAETASFTDTGVKTFYAKWATKVMHSIVFDPGSESVSGIIKGSMKPIMNCLNGMIINLPANKYKVPGYDFLGWGTDSGAEIPVFSDKEKIGNLAENNGETVKLYAVWKPTEYKITYINIDGARLQDEEIFKPTYNLEEGCELPVPVKEGYTFIGWYTTSTFKNGTRIYRIDAGTTGAMTLYAKWQLDCVL